LVLAELLAGVTELQQRLPAGMHQLHTLFLSQTFKLGKGVTLFHACIPAAAKTRVIEGFQYADLLLL
jgi:hypothetical protein